jgi:preprotein translocase subunit YajC
MDTLIINTLISWLPLIALIVVWVFFMRKHRKTQNHTIEYMKKQNDLTERIALAIEKIADGKQAQK